MARARNIKPAFFKNENLVELPFEHRLLFIGLWTESDRRGILEDRPKRLKMELFPADNFDIEAGLAALERSGFIVRYEANSVRLIQVLNFQKHQNPHKDEKASDHPSYEDSTSTMPAPCQHSATSEAAQPITDSLLPITDPLLLNPERGILKEEKESSALPPVPASESFDRFWQAWPKTPRRVSRDKCAAKWRALRLDGRIDEILAKLEALKLTESWRTGYEPAPMTWLNGARYNDELIDPVEVIRPKPPESFAEREQKLKHEQFYKNAGITPIRNEIGAAFHELERIA